MAGPYPLSFLAAILKMMAGLVVVSMCAAARELLGTTHWAEGPQNTLTNASWEGEEDTVLVSPWAEVVADFTAR